MSADNIMQKLIEAQGQSQAERLSEALDIHFVDVDERSTADYHEFLRELSAFIHFYQDDSETPAGDWSEFFPFNQGEAQHWIDRLDDQTPPQLALLHAFLELYRYPRQRLNQITGRHLDFYYQDILKLDKRAAKADKAHLLIELKKNAPVVEISPEMLFTAGKDDSGVELLYAPTATTIINHARVSSLRSLYWNKNQSDAIRYAPVANSADGLGEPIPAEEPKWRGFGHDALPLAETGFALASPLLRLQQGVRTITVSMQLASPDASFLKQQDLSDAFRIFVSGESRWLGPFIVTPALDGAQLSFSFGLAAGDEAVIDYDPERHGYQYAAESPVMQVFLSEHIGYSQLLDIRLKTVQIQVEVTDISSLELENDLGSLSADKAFQPFGSQPEKGARFLIGYAEALEKKLTELKLTLDWKAAPDDFSKHYKNYGLNNIDNDRFTARLAFNDGGNWSVANHRINLFDSDHASVAHTVSVLRNGGGAGVKRHSIPRILGLQNNRWAKVQLDKLFLASPVFIPMAQGASKTPTGYIALELEKDFLHQRYRQQLIKNTLEYATGETDELLSLNEPYTPTIRSIRLSYKASSEVVDVNTASLAQFAQDDIQFYHLTYFGQRREHAYLRHKFDYVGDKNIYLLPHYQNQGELLIGLEHLQPGDSVSLLFQMAEGSADPALAKQTVHWSVLADDYWKTLTAEQVFLDSTHQFLTSGMIKFTLPAEATTENTVMPGGLIWLKAALPDQVDAVCQFIDVQANALEVEFRDQGNDRHHLSQPLPANRINKLKKPLAQVKKVSQPYASFGNAPEERQRAFHTRVSERLRHKDRALTVWDTERLVLARFPDIHRVKCIPHARPGSWLAPGHVMVVVIPELNNKNAIDPLQPRVDSNTLSEIQRFLQDRNSLQMGHHIANPGYQPVQLSFSVQFKPGYEFNYYQMVLQQRIIEYLSPWAFARRPEIHFGGMIIASTLVDFIEAIEFVDFITDFSILDGDGVVSASQVIQPEAADAILVSAPSHIIREYQPGS